MTLVFILYLILLIGIVAWSSNKSKTNTDFVIGGNKLSGYSLALSERATGESAWLLLGLTGHAYAEGITSVWVAIGCMLGIFFLWIFMANPLQRVQQKYGAVTVSALFVNKFPKHTRPITIVTSTVIIFFFMLYIASQFSGAGKIFNNTFGIDPLWGMILGSLLVTFYTMLGGFITVVATDAFQAILMVVTCVVLPIIAYFVAVNNGIDLSSIVSTVPDEIGNADHKSVFSFLLILNGLSWSVGYTGQPQLLTRLMALRNDRETKQARVVAVIWTMLAYVGAFAIGLIGYKLVQSGVLGDVALTLALDAEKIMPTLVMLLLNPLLAGVLLSGAVSAMMSTASSQLMVASTAVSEDLIESSRKHHFSEKRKLQINKILIVVVGLFAFALAILMKETVYGLVSYAWSGIGASFGPAILLLLFWRRFSVAGLYGSLLGGSISTIIWKTWLADITGISERLVSYLVAFSLAVILSYLIPNNVNQTKPNGDS
ncbi:MULTISPECIES: sodium/proline symporter [unclassified Saccharicrinis]|uniref:sodium/proline symporter n=1 Tax=unclassified Saccharicrinis TaxID=2646859 RepID=UPI003D340026